MALIHAINILQCLVCIYDIYNYIYIIKGGWPTSSYESLFKLESFCRMANIRRVEDLTRDYNLHGSSSWSETLANSWYLWLRLSSSPTFSLFSLGIFSFLSDGVPWNLFFTWEYSLDFRVEKITPQACSRSLYFCNFC